MKLFNYPNLFSGFFFFFFFLTTPLILAQKSPIQDEEIAVKKKYQKEIKSLAKKVKIQQAFRTIEELEDQTLKEHILLTEIPAPPFKEDVRAAKFAEMLQQSGADSVWIDEVGNVIVKKRFKR